MHVFRMLAGVLCAITLGGEAMANKIDRPNYTVLDAQDTVELRQYQPAMVAEIDVNGQRSEAVSAAFRPLFRFIQGQNSASQKIAMTSPVVQSADSDGSWVVAFYMPPDMDKAEVPLSTNKDVRVRELPAKKMVAAKWYGRMRDGNINKNTAKVQAYIAQKGLTPVGPPVFAYYDGPFAPSFLREHEVLIPVQ